MLERIVRNAARCRKCDTVIESRHRHEFKWCTCRSIFVDGGTDYLRSGGDPENFETLSIIEGGNDE